MTTLPQKISVIIPCYNQASYLDQCLQSILDQTHSDWECIIINDGSTDNSAEIAQKWVTKDARFQLLDKENEGVTKTRNLGLDKATGNWIQMLDADDFIAPTKLEDSLKYASDATLIISNFDMLVDDKHIKGFCDLGKYDITFESILKGWDVDFNIPIHTALISSKLLGNTRFNKHLKAKEDWIFWLELLKKAEVKVQYLPKVLATYRENNLGASKNFESVYNDMKEAYTYLYNNFDEHAKQVLFEKINLSNYTAYNTVLQQKKYIKQLQNTKVLKFYLKFKSLFN